MQTSQGTMIDICLIVALVLLCGCDRLVLLCGYGQRQQFPSPRVQEAATMTVQSRELELTTALPGRTSAFSVSEIRPQVSGIIEKRLFTEGSRVNAGQALYGIDPEPFQAMLDSAKANHEKAEANLVVAQSKFERYKRLCAENSISQWDYDCEEARLRQAKAHALYCKAVVDIASINLEHTHITAPATGSIGKSNVPIGAFVEAYQNLPLATIQRLDPIYVDVHLSTSELLRLMRRLEAGRLKRNGNIREVGLFLEDGSEYSFKATYQFRDVIADPNTGSVVLKIVFPNPQGVLLPDVPGRVLIKDGSDDQAILIPQAATSCDPRSNPRTLIADAEEAVQRQMLAVNSAIGDKWFVSSALASGDRVIMGGMQRVRPGDSVKAVPLVYFPHHLKPRGLTNEYRTGD